MRDSHALATLGYLPTSLFDRFPYLVTRVVPAMYHIIVVPDDLGEGDLVEITRRQARANALPTRLVRATDSAFYVEPDGREHRGEPPRGGILIADRLRPCRPFSETPALVARRSALACRIEAMKPGGYIMGDLTKGGRPATLEETVVLAGRQPNGVPRGLIRCGRCAEWRGRCLDPSPHFAGQVMDVHCYCANDNRCAGCGGLLYKRKLNANTYNEVDGQVWHTPGFSGLDHTCADEVASQC
jgi:hypothetical protein